MRLPLPVGARSFNGITVFYFRILA